MTPSEAFRRRWPWVTADLQTIRNDLPGRLSGIPADSGQRIEIPLSDESGDRLVARYHPGRAPAPALGSIGCPDEYVDDHAPEGERERDQIAEPVAAPVACPHCGAALRLVRDIPRQRPAHASRAPPSERPNHGSQP